jgi:uncharacterized membrane protein
MEDIPSPSEMGAPPEPQSYDREFVWTFRGYRLRASEFTTAMVHFFRAEVQRANVWRQRLDATTNWAVITTGAVLSIAFAQTSNHVIILMNMLLVTIFLFIEARRYRYYELWAYRVRLMETDFFAAMLVPPFHPSEDWAEALSESLLHPQFPISQSEAIGRRLRRNYLAIYMIMAVAWISRIYLMPLPADSWQTFYRRAAVGPIGGEWVLLFGAAFVAMIVLLSLGTISLHDSPGEVLPRYGVDSGTHIGKRRAWFRPSRRRSQLFTLIITDRREAVAERVLQEMHRGVTALSGTGMFTGTAHAVLMCALTVTEVPHLKALVAQADPNAFVVVMPAQEILGKGFVPLHTE